MSVERDDEDSGEWQSEDLRTIVSGGIPKPMDAFTLGDLYFFLISDLISKYRRDPEVDTGFVVRTDANGDWVSLDHFALHKSLFSEDIPVSLWQEYEQIFKDYSRQFPEKFEVEVRRALEDGSFLEEVKVRSDGAAEGFQRRGENLNFLIECLEMSSEKLAANSFGAHLAQSCKDAVQHLLKFAIASPQYDEIEMPIRYIEEDDWEGASPEQPKY